MGPLNYILLDHPELQAIQDRVNMVNLHEDGERYYPQESLHNLNTTEGVAGEAFDSFLEERSQREVLAGVDRATRDKRRRETTQKKLNQGKRFTAGPWDATGNHCIDMEVMAIIRKSRSRQNQKELDKKQKGEEEKNKLLTQVRAVLSNEKPPEQWKLDEWTCPRIKNDVFFLQTQDRQSIT
jgi:hypothetical protein